MRMFMRKFKPLFITRNSRNNLEERHLMPLWIVAYSVRNTWVSAVLLLIYRIFRNTLVSACNRRQYEVIESIQGGWPSCTY